MAHKSKEEKHAYQESCELMTALLHCKGGPMRDRRCRREKEKKDDWKKDLL